MKEAPEVGSYVRFNRRSLDSEVLNNWAHGDVIQVIYNDIGNDIFIAERCSTGERAYLAPNNVVSLD